MDSQDKSRESHNAMEVDEIEECEQVEVIAMTEDDGVMSGQQQPSGEDLPVVYCYSEVIEEEEEDFPGMEDIQNVVRILPQSRSGRKRPVNVDKHAGAIMKLKKQKHSKTKDERLSNMKRAASHQLKAVDPTVFIETRAYKKAKELLDNFGIVVLVGSPGSGKTTLGLNLLSVAGDVGKRQVLVFTHHTQFEDLPIPKDLKKIKDEDKWVIMIDDMFGRSNLVAEFQQSWELKFLTLWHLIEVGLIKVIITFRSQIFHECQTNLSEFAVFQDSHKIDLHSDDYSLSTNEKVDILNQHLNKSRVTMSDEEKDLAASLVFTELGFPQCCHFYVNSPAAQQRGVDYFRKPIEYLRRQLDKIKSEDQSQFQYLVLLIVMFKQGTLKEACLDPFTEDRDTLNLIRTLKGVCRINTDVSPGQIKASARSLCGLYMEYDVEQKEYSFVHQSVFDTLFLQFSSEFLEQSIKICPVSLLLEYVVTQEAPQKGPITVTVAKEHYPVLAERFTDLLKSDCARCILSHQSFKDEQFVKYLTEVFWNFKVPFEILSKKLDPENHEISVVFHQNHLELLWDQLEKEPDLSNLDFSCMSNYSELSINLVTSSSPSSVAVMKNLKTLANHFVSFLCKVNFNMLKHKQEQEQEEHQKKEQEQEQEYEEILNIACFVGNAEVADMLLTLGIVPTLQTFTAAAVSLTDNVMILENIFNHKKDLQLSLHHLGSMLFLGIENGNGKVSSLLIDQINALEDNNVILERAVKQLLLQCHSEIENSIAGQYISEAASLFRKLSRFSATLKSEIVIFLAVGHSDSGILKEIINMTPTCLKTKKNKTILHMASRYGCLDSVALLLDQGCDISAVNKEKQTSLHLAAEYNSSDVVLFLLRKGADPNVTDANKNTPLHLAILEDCMDSVKALVGDAVQLNKIDVSGVAPIHVAAKRSSVECVKYLLDRGSEINLLDENGKAPLHVAAQYTNSTVGLYLLQQGADPYIADTSNFLLHWAVDTDSLDATELLVKKGFDLDAGNLFGDTPLHIAVNNNSLHLVKFLVKKGSKVNLFNCYGVTPLHIAVTCPTLDVGLYLLCKGADANLVNSNKQSPLHLAVDSLSLEITKAMVGKGVNMNTVDDSGNTPLHIAIKSNPTKLVPSLVPEGSQVNKGITGKKLDMCIYLLRNGADYNATDTDKKSPLHLAVLSDSLRLAQALVENGAKVNAVDSNGKTPLHLASEGSSLEFVTYLVKNRSQLNLPDVGGKTPLHIAASCNASDVGMCLLKNGADPNVIDAENNSPLHLAVRANSFDLSESLLAKGAKQDALDARGNTPLHIAAKHSSLQIVSLLVENGSQLNICKANGKMPLHLAARNKTSDVGVYLVHRGADPQVIDAQNNTPLHLAVRADYPQFVEALIKKGAELNTAGYSGLTPLHTAGQYSSLQIVSYLVENGSRLDILDKSGKTPLQLAAEHNTSDVCLYLLRKESGHSSNADSTTIPLLFLAAKKCYVDLAKTLIESGEKLNATDDSGNTPLHIAIKNNSVELVTYLVKGGCQINIQNEDGMTPLCLAVTLVNTELSLYLLNNRADSNVTQRKNKQFPLHLAVEKCSLDLVKALCEHGACINAADESKNTPLHVAVKEEWTEGIQYLVETGAEVNLTNNLQKSPLCMWELFDSPEISLYLLSKGADPNITDYNNISPLHLAFHSLSLELLKSLVDKGASVNAVDNYHDTPLHFATKCENSLECVTYLLEQGAEVNVKNFKGETPLHSSAKYNFSDLVLCLLDNGVDPDITDQEMNTALHLAVEKCSSESVEALVSKGANLNMLDAFGNSPLHSAVQRDYTECVTCLVENGCQMNLTNKKGLRPFDLAVRLGYSDMALYLLSKGADLDVTITNNACLHLAVQADSIELIKALVEKGVKLNAKHPTGNTLLHNASCGSSVQIVRYLLEHGLEVNKANDSGITPLHLAAGGLRSLNTAGVGYRVIKLLLDAGSEVEAEDERGYTPLMYACASGDLKNVQLLLEKGAKPNHGNITAMHVVAGFHLLDILEFFLAKEGNPKLFSKAGNTLLHVAVRWELPERVFSRLFSDITDGSSPILAWRDCFDYLIGDSSLEKPWILWKELYPDSELEFELILSRFDRKPENENVVDMLLRNGCCIDVRNKAGQTVLHVCIEYDQLENLKLMLDKGADVSVVDEKGNSLLHYAVLQVRVDVVQVLLDAGAVDVRNINGVTASDVARSKLEHCDNEDMKNNYVKIISLLNQKTEAMQH